MISRRRLADFAPPLFAVLAVLVLLVRAERAPGVEIEVRDPSPGVDEIHVQVAGAVRSPGVFVLLPGQRVADSVELAGGATADADTTALNLARRVADQDQVVVPRRGERVTRPLDLNRATADELMALPGVGATVARRIVAARDDARFASSDELVSRGLLGARAYEEIRDRVATP